MLRIGWLESLEFRAEFLMSVLSWGIRLAIAFFLWFAILQDKGGEVAGYTLDTILIYFFLVQIVASLLFTRLGFDMVYDIYRGDIANFLLKPMNYLSFRFFHSVGKQAFRVLAAGALFGSLIFIFVGAPPFGWWKIPMVIFAMSGGYIINYCFHALIAAGSFWLVNTTRFMFIYFGILTMTSGMIVPLDLFPPTIFSIMKFLPFTYLFFYPAQIVLAESYESTLLFQAAIEMAYIIFLLAVVAAVFSHGIKKFEGVGR